MRESVIESKVSQHARGLGWKVFKFTSPNMKGVPDRMFIRQGIVIFVEFKATGKVPTKLQSAVIKQLREEHMGVYVIDDVVFGVNLFNQFE